MPGVDISSLTSRSLDKRKSKAASAVGNFFKKEVHAATQKVSQTFQQVKQGTITAAKGAQKIGAKAYNAAKKAGGVIASKWILHISFAVQA